MKTDSQGRCASGCAGSAGVAEELRPVVMTL
jgi:hypothetical protein